MEQTEIKRKKTRVLLLIMLVILLSLVFIKLLMHKMNRYIDENGKSSMGAVVEQIQQTYDLQVNGYYSQLHLVEDYLLQEKELSLETDTHKKIFEAWEKESESTLLFLQENGKAITVDGKKIRIDIPSKLLLDLRNGHNIRSKLTRSVFCQSLIKITWCCPITVFIGSNTFLPSIVCHFFAWIYFFQFLQGFIF